MIAPWPADEAEMFERVWSYDRANSVIAIGWDDVDVASARTREQLNEAVPRAYPGTDPNGGSQPLWDFYHEIQVDDVILARRGRKICLAVGRVLRVPPRFDVERGLVRTADP